MRFGSLEVRWFFDGVLPDSGDPVVEWFRDSRPLARDGDPPPPSWPTRWRNDVYLVLPDQDDMGVKWRREAGEDEETERLEFKGRVAYLGDVTLGSGARGRLERWMKWSYPVASIPAGLRRAFDGAETPEAVPVRKKRLLRLVRIDDAGAAVEVTSPGAGPSLRRGLEFELTRGEAGGSPFWTLAFEAFPYEPRVREAFRGIAARLLEGYPGPRPTLEDSRSYPAWLQRFV